MHAKFSEHAAASDAFCPGNRTGCFAVVDKTAGFYVRTHVEARADADLPRLARATRMVAFFWTRLIRK